MTILLSLIGEQPIPNLLPIRYFKPAVALAVHSDFTRRAAERLGGLVSDQTEFHSLQVNAYDIQDIRQVLLNEVRQYCLAASDPIFNLTGGTKPMSLAAYLVAAELGVPVIYLQSEGKRSRLLRYEFKDGVPVLADDLILPGLITIDDNLRAHVGTPTERLNIQDDEGHHFEQVLMDALQSVVDEIRGGVNLTGIVDIDIVLRCDNQVGIVEAKTGMNGMKKAIDQLNTAGGQKYLGTYMQKFLVSDQAWSERSNLKALAEARQVTVIELPGYGKERLLSAEERAKLESMILKGLGR